MREQGWGRRDLGPGGFGVWERMDEGIEIGDDGGENGEVVGMMG